MELAPAERWSRIEELFAEALDLPPAERRVLLETTRSRDEALYRDLSRLLSAHESAGDFLESLDGVRAAELLGSAGFPDVDPDTIGPYRVVRRLGSGGMGVVYLAHDERLDRPVALKVLRPHLTVDGGARRRLLREARAASALDHPNVATVYEVGETPGGQVFIAMAYCPGHSLAERIGRGPIPPREAAGLGRQLAEGLAAAHRLGVVHRDVKPGNLLVSEDGRLRIVDFGVARVAAHDPEPGVTSDDVPSGGPAWSGGGATGAGAPGPAGVAGTLSYMSPEQVRGAPVGPGADVWAMGVVLYEMLSGRRPFEGTRTAMVSDILGADPPPLDPAVPSSLAEIVGGCLQKEPFERPAGAREVADALAAFLGDGASAPGRRLRRPRVRGVLAAVAAVLAAVAAVVGYERLARPGSDLDVPPGALAVLPLVPATPDTALERLGRELVVTLSATLDGMGGIRTVEPVAVLAQLVPGSGWAPAEGVRAARALGAASFLGGTLTRTGDGVRLDLAVHDVDDAGAPFQAVVSVPTRDVAAVSDSATLTLLREALGEQEVPLPSPAALRTSSVAALEAYLEGEMAIAGGRFRTAPEAFLRAIREDSTFWYAYWRYAYARSYHGLAVDSAIWAAVLEHRDEFPEPDRLLVEARLAEDRTERLQRLRSITGRFPTYVPAWFELGDALVHHGPYLGRSARETGPVLDRVLALQPTFVPAHAHRLWAGTLVLDTARTTESVERLVELRFDSLVQTEWNLETLDLYRYLAHGVRTGGEPAPELAAVGVSMMEGYAGPYAPERIAPSLTKYGFHRAQLDLGRRIEASTASPDVKAAYRWASALAWAGRGGWDSATVAARRYARSTSSPRGALHAYGLAAAGAWLGPVDPDSTEALRVLAAGSSEAATSDGRAELEWLGGLVACARGDAAVLERHRRRLAASGGAHAARLELTLDAFQADLDGRGAGLSGRGAGPGTPEAARTLADRQWADAERAFHFSTGHLHPFLSSVERLAAGRALLVAGDSTEAARLLVWHEADFPGSLYPLQSVNVVMGNAALPLLASLHEARGFPEVAAAYRTVFRQRHDLAPDAGPRLAVGMCGAG